MAGAGRAKSPESLVGDLYRLLLQREPDAEGLTRHAAALRRNQVSFTELVLGFVDSEEFGVLTGRRWPETRVSAYGCEFVLPADPIAAQIGAQAYEPWVLPCFLDSCRPGMTVLDIGASWGAFALPAARRVGETGRVWAIEASRGNCEVLARSARASGLSNVEILPLAVSDRLGAVVIARHDHACNNRLVAGRAVGEAPTEGGETVPTVPLDLLAPALGPVHLVKMDIEGMEHRAVSGGLGLFRAHRPTVFMEYSPQFQREGSGVDGRDLLGLVFELGYGVEILHRDRPREAVPVQDREAAIRRIDGAWRAHCERDGGTHLDLRLQAEG